MRSSLVASSVLAAVALLLLPAGLAVSPFELVDHVDDDITIAQAAVYGTLLPRDCAIDIIATQGLNCGSWSGDGYEITCDGDTPERCTASIHLDAVASRWIQEGGMTISIRSALCNTDDDHAWIAGGALGPVAGRAACSRVVTVQQGECQHYDVGLAITFRGQFVPTVTPPDPMALDIGWC